MPPFQQPPANLNGRADPQVVGAMGDMVKQIQDLRAALDKVANKPPVPLDYAAIAKNLSTRGGSPLNIQNLLGVTGNPQRALVPQFTAKPVNQSIYNQPGTLTSIGGVLNIAGTGPAAAPSSTSWDPQGAIGVVLQGTHANRLASFPASSYPIGALFFETDRTVFYINQGTFGSSHWQFATGEFSCTQATLPVGLGANDAGFLASVFDYGHLLIWSGSAWAWGPGDAGSGMLQMFEVDPTGAGWHLYDGSAVSYLKADGTLGSITLPNISGAAPTQCYLKTSNTPAGPTAPVAPTFTGGALSGVTFTGTPATITSSVSSASFTGNSATLTGTNSVPTFTGSALAAHSHDSPVGVINATTGGITGAFGAGTLQTIADTFTIASSVGSFSVQKTGTTSAGTPAGTVTAPTLTMNSYTPSGTISAQTASASYTPAGSISGGSFTGTVGTNGEPESLSRRAWFRQ